MSEDFYTLAAAQVLSDRMEVAALGRVSRAEAAKRREQAVEHAARLFREHGFDGVTVKDVMAQLGLTSGGFYKQFESKEALAEEAVSGAFGQMIDLLDGIAADHEDDRSAARSALLDTYLSAEHRDNPGAGCPAAAWGVDVARGDDKELLRDGYHDGVSRYIDRLSLFESDDHGDEDRIMLLATLIGALTLARATRGTEFSDKVLETVRTRLARTV
jgi:TetR/AcrR family transcriptional regulator, transcriptional repressor for nem operon